MATKTYLGAQPKKLKIRMDHEEHDEHKEKQKKFF